MKCSPFRWLHLGRQCLVPAVRSFSTSTSALTLDHHVFEQAISEVNVTKCIERMKRIKLGNPARYNASASVFIPFCLNAKGEPSILFTRRSFQLSKHKGEVCFPGGFEEDEDENVTQSAVRELMEEIGVQKQDIKVYGLLNAIAFREIALYPVLGHLDLHSGNQLVINADEVDSVHIIPLRELIDPANWYKTQWAHGWTTPVFLDVERKYPRIWGMTSSILYILLANLMPKYFEFDFTYINRG